MEKPTNPRFVFMDGLRGITAIFVLLYHSKNLGGFSFYRSYLAVDLLFILSGFVIAHAYCSHLTHPNGFCFLS